MNPEETHCTCPHCGANNRVPNSPALTFACWQCSGEFRLSAPSTGETSAAVGLIGGAALGAAIFGPVGAVIGGILGAVIGKESKGLG